MRTLGVFFTLLILILGNSSIALSQNFVSGISSNKINIDSNFNGQDILLFGAKSSAGKLIIAVRGPKKNFLVTKKGQTLGIWHSKKRVKFENITSYYAIFSTFDDNSVPHGLLKILGLGSDNLQYDTEDNIKISDAQESNFTHELVKNLKKDNLYSTGAGRINFLDETLFKVNLNFPKNISQGVYNADLYFINDGNLESFQTIPIYVNQSGLSAKISRMAYQDSFIYGIIAILLALIIGWIANYIFNRFIEK